MSVTGAYHALAHPTRRRVLRLLRDGDQIAGELAGEFDVSWPSVSRHLRVLETAGLVSSKRQGGNVIYSLQTSVLQDIASEVADMAGAGSGARRHPPVAAREHAQPAGG